MIRHFAIGVTCIVLKEIVDSVFDGDNSMTKKAFDGTCVIAITYCMVKPIIDVLLDLNELTK